MKYINQIFLFLIVVSLVAIAYFLYKLGTPESSTVSTNKVSEVSSARQITESQNDNPEVTKTQTASVSGKLCYPSEFIPAMSIYLKNVDSDDVLVLETQQNQSLYTFETVNPGKYIAFAYPNNNSESGGSYSNAVPCGLTISCTDHELIEVEVKAGLPVTQVDICDWYSPDSVPQKP